MQVISSCQVEIKKPDRCIRRTMDIYREAVAWLIPVYDSTWEEILLAGEGHRRFNRAEHLVHNTKKNRAVFDFDRFFYKMPSYLRRAAIRHALGAVSSYRTRLADWEAGTEPGKKPVLSASNHAMPVFYHDIMYKDGGEGRDAAYLKLYNGKDWEWKEVSLLRTDMEYIRKHWAGRRACAPVLEKRRKKYYLRFSYEEEIRLVKKEPEDRVICAVDLGVNTDAVCTIMRSDGTILGRKFIDHPCDKDRLWHAVNRIRRFQREQGSRNAGNRWAYVRRLNEEWSKKVAAAVATYAKGSGADVVVFEYLDMHGRIRGSKRQRLHLWRKRDIVKRCEHRAHRYGMRVSRVNAWNTSALAFDGSGKVERSKKNHSMCVFRNGKRYHCDLSASYNIGARYYVRELTKPLPETVRSLLEAKVPSVKRRTSCTYADLVRLHRELYNKGAVSGTGR